MFYIDIQKKQGGYCGFPIVPNPVEKQKGGIFLDAAEKNSASNLFRFGWTFPAYFPGFPF